MRVLQFARRSVLTMAALGLALSGCSDSSGPTDAPFNAAGTSTDASAVGEAFSSAATVSFASVGGEINAHVGSSWNQAVGAVPFVGALSNRSGAVQYARKLAQGYVAARGTVRPSFSGASIPNEYRGKTFIWDADSDQYIVSTLSGAPSTGVRFRLYAISPVPPYLPAEPLNDVGYADIIETGPSSNRVRVVSGAITYLDYTVTVSPTSGGGEMVRLSGYGTNGTNRVEFDLAHTVSISDETGLTLDLDYELEVPTRGFRIEMEISIEDLGNEAATITQDFEARGEHGTVRLTGSEAFDGTSGSHTVRVNGDVFATVTVHNGVAEFTGANGQALTAVEMDALESIYELFVGALFFFLGVMFTVY